MKKKNVPKPTQMAKGVPKYPAGIDHVHIERSEIHETGGYDLDGLFVRLNHAIDSIRARRVVLAALQDRIRSEHELKRKRAASERQIDGLRAEFAAEEQELLRAGEEVATRTRVLTNERAELARLRHADGEITLETRTSRKTDDQHR